MKKKPGFVLAIIPIVALLLLLGIGYGLFHLRAEPLLIIAATIAAVIGKSLGVSWEEMQNGIVETTAKSMSAILILITVGVLIGTWMVAGTIPMMIFYGIKLIDPNYLLITAFFVAAIVSTFTGTSWGSAGTIGVAVMGIALVQGVSLPMTAGAVVAGAYFGDKLSPLSDTTNLAPAAAGSKLYEHIKHMLYTTIPAAIIGLIVYFIAGKMTTITSGDNQEALNEMTSTLVAMYDWNLLLIVPILIVLAGSILKYPTIPVMLASSTIAIILGVTFQGVSIANAFLSTVSGFDVSMMSGTVDSAKVPEDVSNLLNRGGMTSMMGTTLIAFCSFAFAGIISKIGCLDVVLEKVNEKAQSTGSLILATVLSCITIAITTGSSYLSILIPGELFRNVYAERGLHPKNLSRTLEDSGTVVVPIVPWSLAGVYMSSTLGVPVIEFLPWAVMCYVGFIFAIIYGYTGFSIEKIKPSAEVDSSKDDFQYKF
ncbi:Na+/H+ antiporter NhaC [Pseudobacillus badius]|uniref:Na+/H+ antiporter NhaC n=1 Tax=Bacillus badius TaxID=1455 RepID=UPI0007B08831|nr:Na+/H+ antiporter NhaC [Bacillus badius]KZN99038.1 Na+/H+ antiporter NhaC [Bacillus badius]OCS83977.1 Na+/H+ antiporter NhaC [Bacillus badius]OVE52729.1 Na+/H+ antiporter NhaC [Bacillus badius]TDW04746.1 transporter (NhaC family) [Bacillus badius]